MMGIGYGLDPEAQFFDMQQRTRDFAVGWINTVVPLLAIATLAYTAFGVKQQNNLLDISVFKGNKKGGNGHLFRSASLKDGACLDAVREVPVDF